MNNTIDHVKLDTEFAGTKVNLKELSAVIGDHGSVMASGSYELHGGESPYALTAAIRDVFIDSRQIGGKVNGDISVTQKNGIPFVAGALNLEDLYIGLTSVPSLAVADRLLVLTLQLISGRRCTFIRRRSMISGAAARSTSGERQQIRTLQAPSI